MVPGIAEEPFDVRERSLSDASMDRRVSGATGDFAFLACGYGRTIESLIRTNSVPRTPKTAVGSSEPVYADFMHPRDFFTLSPTEPAINCDFIQPKIPVI